MATKKPGGAMTVAEAGRMGGKLVSEKYGPEFFGRIGQKGGRAVTAKYGAGHFERIGRKGGQKVASLVERAKTIDASETAGGNGGETAAG